MYIYSYIWLPLEIKIDRLLQHYFSLWKFYWFIIHLCAFLFHTLHVYDLYIKLNLSTVSSTSVMKCTKLEVDTVNEWISSKVFFQNFCVNFFFVFSDKDCSAITSSFQIGRSDLYKFLVVILVVYLFCFSILVTFLYYLTFQAIGILSKFNVLLICPHEKKKLWYWSNFVLDLRNFNCWFYKKLPQI